MHDTRISPPATPGSRALPLPDRFNLRNTCPDIKIGLEIELTSDKSYRFCEAGYYTNIATIDLGAAGGRPARQIGKIMGEDPIPFSLGGRFHCKIEFVSRPMSLSNIDMDDLKSFLKLVRKAASKFTAFRTQTQPIHALTGCDSVVEPTFNSRPDHPVDEVTLRSGTTWGETVGNFDWVADGDMFSIYSVQVNVGIPTISFAHAFGKSDTKDVIGFDLLNNLVKDVLHPPNAVTETDSFHLLQEQLTAEQELQRHLGKHPTKDSHPILPKSRSDELVFFSKSAKPIPPFTCSTAGGKVTEGLVVEVRNNFNHGQPILNTIKLAIQNGMYCGWLDNFVNDLTSWWAECIDANPGHVPTSGAVGGVPTSGAVGGVPISGAVGGAGVTTPHHD